MVVIAVHGSASRFLPAERGTLRLALGWEHADRAAAVAKVTALHEHRVADAKTFVHGGAATWWGSDQVRVRTERRYHEDESWSTVHVATAEVTVKFRDFSALSTWFEQAGGEPGASVDGITWAVTEQRRAQVQREMRVEAVRDAVRRAEAYAGAIDGGSVQLLRLWEPGLRPHAADQTGGGVVTRAALSSANSGGIELRPDDIEIGASVTADFAVLEA